MHWAPRSQVVSLPYESNDRFNSAIHLRPRVARKGRMYSCNQSCEPIEKKALGKKSGVHVWITLSGERHHSFDHCHKFQLA
jgi:hypothetical protein